MKYLPYLYGFFTCSVFILIGILLIKKPENSENIIEIVMVLTLINAIIFIHRWYLQSKFEYENLDLKSKIKKLEEEDEGFYDDLDKAQKQIESFKKHDDLEFKKSNVPGVCENYKEYFDSINETHHGPPK